MSQVTNKMYNMAVNPVVSVAEVISVPAALHGYVLDPKFSAVLLKIKEQSGVNFLSVARPTASDPDVGINVDAQTPESGLFAKQLLELKFKHQMKIAQSETKLRKTQDDVFSTQGSLASGHIVEFDVPREVIGLIIGKKGARVRQVEEDTGVQNIRVSDNERDGTGHVTIVGKDSVSVRAAREAMEMKAESIPVSAEHLAYFRRAHDRSRTVRYDERASMEMTDLRDTAGLSAIRVDVPKQSVVFTGTISSLRSAKMLFDVHLENVNEILELEAKQKQANLELYEVKSKFGGGGGRGGAVGGRGAFGGRGVATSRDNYNNGNGGNRGAAASSNRNQNQNQDQKPAAAKPVQKPANLETNVSSNKKGKNSDPVPPPAPVPTGKSKKNGGKVAPPAPPVSAEYVANTAAVLNSIGKADGKKQKDQKQKDAAAPAAAPAKDQKQKDQKQKDQKPKDAAAPAAAPAKDQKQKDQKQKDQKQKDAAAPAAAPAKDQKQKDQKQKDQKPKDAAAPTAAAPAKDQKQKDQKPKDTPAPAVAAGDKPLPKRNKNAKKDNGAASASPTAAE